MIKKINFKVQLPDWFNRLYSEAIWRIPSGEKVVYLTFDDGPVPGVTRAVLDILKKHNIVATFFCVGDNVFKYPDIYQEIIKEGHSTGNHTFNHLHGMKNSKKTYLDNVEQASRYIHSDLFRPPYGLFMRSQYRVLKKQYKIIMWDVISCDYDGSLSPEECYSNVIDFVRDGSIITFHDSYKSEKNVLTALPRVIEQLKKEGYIFKKIEINSSVPGTSIPLNKRLFAKQKVSKKVRARA